MPGVKLSNGVVINFDGSAKTLLEALERKQQEINYHCREGYCGACRCKLVSGDVNYINEPLAFVRKGEFLPCCSVPVTDIEIEIP